MNYQNANVKGGEFPMMGWDGYGYQMAYRNFGWGFGIVQLVFGLVILVDLIFLGMFLWKKIRK